MDENYSEGRTQVYELGYHIVPSVSMDSLPQEVNAIRSLIEENNGIVISDDFPKSRTLAYPLYTMVQGAKVRCDSSYFGWIKFEMHSSGVKAIKEWADKNPHLLRYLLIKTVKENTLYSQKLAQAFKMQGGEEMIKKEKIKSSVEKVKMSTEEIDKTIDEMIKE